jgi:hypothetical protein
MPDPSDMLYVLFLILVVWLAIELWNDGDGGGGRRARVPALS